jgi:peroxiredoxin (alkyl hydroperoxide reductase subunit C)
LPLAVLGAIFALSNLKNIYMIGVGEKFPKFSKLAVTSLEKGKEFETINSDYLENDDNVWTVMFWWPKDFTFVCPTEIAEFNKSYGEFRDRETRLIGASTDSEFVHLAWRNNHDDLRGLKFPMLADTSKSLAQDLGILTNDDEKVAYRATFIIDPTGIIRWVSVNDLSVGRNVKEVLRVLDGLQTDELCPCNWEKGQETLTV